MGCANTIPQFVRAPWFPLSDASCANIPLRLLSDGLIGKWTFIVFQRLGAASFTMKARLIDAASYAFTTNKTVDVGDMTESGPSYLASYQGASNSSNGAIACPRVYLHGSSSAFSEAELNAIFEKGKRFLIGDS